MTSRREFLQAGISATALPLASRAARAAELPAVERVHPYKVVYDGRFPDSIAFARRAETIGLSVHAIKGDVTRFWYDDLYYRWKKGPAAIAGLTGHGALFCLEHLARDQRMRVVFRAVHTFVSGSVEHELTGPPAMVRDAMALDARATRWGSCLADVIARCPSGRTEITHVRARSGVGADEAAADDGALYSWVIA